MTATATTAKPRLVKRAGLLVPFKTRPVGDLPAMTGTVELASAGQWETLAESVDKNTDRDGIRLEAEFYARHVKSWDFYGDDAAAEPLPLTAANVLALPPAVYLQLAGVIRGETGTK